MNTRLRAAVAYLATAAFFTVAALGQVQGDEVAGSLMKAGVACIVVLVLGGTAISIVETATLRAASLEATPRAKANAEATPEVPGEEATDRAA